MAVEGKKRYVVYLDEESTEYVKSFLETTKNKRGLSGLVDDHIRTMAATLKASKYKPGEKIGVAKILRVFKNGLQQKIL